MVRLLLPNLELYYKHKISDLSIVYNDEVNDRINEFWITLKTDLLKYVNLEIESLRKIYYAYDESTRDRFLNSHIDRIKDEFNDKFDYTLLNSEFQKIVDSGQRAKKSQNDYRWRKYLHESELYILKLYTDEDFKCITKNLGTEEKLNYISSIIGEDRYKRMVYFNSVILYYYRIESYHSYMPEFLYYLMEKLSSWYGMPYESIKNKLPDYVDGEHLPDDFLNWIGYVYGPTQRELSPITIKLDDESDKIDLHFEVPKFDMK